MLQDSRTSDSVTCILSRCMLIGYKQGDSTSQRCISLTCFHASLSHAPQTGRPPGAQLRIARARWPHCGAQRALLLRQQPARETQPRPLRLRASTPRSSHSLVKPAPMRKDTMEIVGRTMLSAWEFCPVILPCCSMPSCDDGKAGCCQSVHNDSRSGS